MQIWRQMQGDPKFPIHTLPGGFSPTPEEENPERQQKPNPEEKLEGINDEIINNLNK